MRIRKSRHLLMLTIYFFISISCQDVFESNIENDFVSILAPPDSMRTSNNNITFWWDYLNGADAYNIQIVTPDFNYIETIIVDTNISENKFSINLTKGNYQWRICAYNSAYSTPYIVSYLIVDSISEK